MTQKFIAFRIPEKTHEIFKGKCKSEEKNMYSILKWLVDRYIKNEITQAPSSIQLEAQEKDFQVKEGSYNTTIRELNDQIAELKKLKTLYNVQDATNLGVLKRICDYAVKTNGHQTPMPLTDNEINFCFRFLNNPDLRI